MKNKSENLQIVQDDILRYKKNKLGQWLTYGGLAFSCLYIMLLYSFHNSTFYTMLMGGSVMLSLVMLLMSFLAAEGVKSYNKKYCIILIILAVIQIVRIFIYPRLGLKGVNGQSTSFWFTGGEHDKIYLRDYFRIILSPAAAFALLVIYLSISAGLFAAAAVVSYLICVRHEKFNKLVAEGAVDINAALKGVEEEEQAAQALKAQEAVAMQNASTEQTKPVEAQPEKVEKPKKAAKAETAEQTDKEVK